MLHCSPSHSHPQVGSYALMHGTGFELMDMLYCCKFAEGDSRILQQKLARDRLKALQRAGAPAAIAAVLNPFEAVDSGEALSAISVAMRLQPAGRDPAKLGAAMDAHWRQIYDLAEAIAARHMRTGERGAFLEPAVDRIQPSSPRFDHDWKAEATGKGSSASEAKGGSSPETRPPRAHLDDASKRTPVKTTMAVKTTMTMPPVGTASPLSPPA